jgi:hypothetical protein
MNEPKTSKENITLFTILSAIFEKIKANAGKEKVAAVKLSTKDISAIKSAKKHEKLSESQFQNMADLVLRFDTNLRVLQQITSTAVTNFNEGVASALVEDCAKLASVCLINKEQAQKKSVFLMLWEGPDVHKSVQRFMDLLENQVQLRIKKIEHDLDDIDGVQAASSAFDKGMFDSKQTSKNISSIGLFWLVSKGLAENASIIEYLLNRFGNDIEIDQSAMGGISLYLIQKSLPTRDRQTLMVGQYFRQQRAEVQHEKNVEASRRQATEKALTAEQQKVTALKQENEAFEKKIRELELSLGDKQSQLKEQHELGKAERVHLKDDHGKAKFKTLNTLEEDVLPLLSKTNHALDKEVPKVHVATHQLELITEEIEGLIKWLKK